MAKFPLDPQEIADYASKSAAVGAVLDSAELTRITADYADESAWANETQSRFNRVARQLNVSVLITNCDVRSKVSDPAILHRTRLIDIGA